MSNITRTSTTELIMELTKRIESAKAYEEQTGREEALTKLIHKHEEMNEKLASEKAELEREVQRQQDLGQGYYDSMMTYKSQIALLEERIKTLEYDLTAKTAQANAWKKKYDELEQATALVNALEQPEKPTMPVIPKDVAIAIFREGVQHGVEAACTELEESEVRIEESEYIGDFEVSFSKTIDLEDELDLDWMRGKVGDYSEEFVTGALNNLCADKEFECRIHGIDDQEEKKND